MEVAVAGLAVRLLSATIAKQPWYTKILLRSGPSEETTSRSSHPRGFRYHELAEATNNFEEDYKLGQGGFGPVYRGYLTDQDLHVAIKVLSKESSSQGQREFEAEVAALSQVRHRNIVQLLGWCRRRHNGLLLVYELVTEGSLDKHLYDPDKFLNWQQRYKIVLDLGYALRYLHNDCEKCIVHGDIKPANIMLDASHNAKLGDFGLARLIEHGAEAKITQVIAGTAGYMDPEFINNSRRCPEQDVYSFGVVLLEIACGKRPAVTLPDEAPRLLAWVLDMYHDQSRILETVDRRLNGQFDQHQMERVLLTGLWCAHHDPTQRPSIAEAMDFLRSADAKLPVIPAARRDAEHIRSMEAQAFGEITVEYSTAPAGGLPTTYYTSMDLAQGRAQE